MQLLKCEPNYNLWFGDGERFELSSSTEVMKREVERYEGKDGFGRYLDWLGEAHRHYEVSVREVLHRNFTSIFGLLRWSFLSNVVQLHPFESIYARASRYFKSERLRRVFTFGSMYMGMSPFDAPGTYSLLQYTELAEGIWYPVGGFWAVVEALVKVGERLGVKYRLGCAVERVILSQDGQTAKGVRLQGGEELYADVVVVNADLVYAYNNLFPSTTQHTNENTTPLTPTPYAHSLTQRDGSCSSISFYWSLSRKVPALTTHNIFLADDYKESFDSIFKAQSIPDEPSFYVNVPSRIDPTAAPPDKDSIVVLVPVGHLQNSRVSGGGSILDGKLDPSATTGAGLNINNPKDLQKMVDLARTTILTTIKARTGTDLTPHITNEILNTPTTWEDTFNLDKGCILGLSHSFFNVLAFRPSIKHTESPGALNLLPGVGAKRGLKNVYFVGASTHPGTGVPIVLAGSKITSEQVLSDSHMSIPWSTGKGKKAWEKHVGDLGKMDDGENVKDIDVLKPAVIWTTETFMFLILVWIVWGLWWVGFVTGWYHTVGVLLAMGAAAVVGVATGVGK